MVNYDMNNEYIQGFNQKTEELRVLAEKCHVPQVQVFREIADSTELANIAWKKTATDHQNFGSGHFYALWWATFLNEWSLKCFQHYQNNCCGISDDENLQNLWYSDIEPLWEVGCEVVRLDRLSKLTIDLSKQMSQQLGTQRKIEQKGLQTWIDSYNEAVLQAITRLREKHRVTVANLKQKT